MLHDLGKAFMPQDILNKPGKLTAEEFEVIKTHPVRGYDALRASGSFSAAIVPEPISGLTGACLGIVACLFRRRGLGSCTRHSL